MNVMIKAIKINTTVNIKYGICTEFELDESEFAKYLKIKKPPIKGAIVVPSELKP